jgi:hypothetical protein
MEKVGLFDAEHSSAAQRFPQLASCVGNAKPARNQTPNIKQPENGLLTRTGVHALRTGAVSVRFCDSCLGSPQRSH